MSDDIERPSFTAWCLACFATEAAACTWFLGAQKVNRPPLWQLLVAMITVALLYVGIYQWRCWKWKIARREKIAAEKVEEDAREAKKRQEAAEAEAKQGEILAAQKAREEAQAASDKLAFLEEPIPCHGFQCEAQRREHPRKEFYLVEEREGMVLREMCGGCFYYHFHEDPSIAKRAYPDVAAQEPKCFYCDKPKVGEDATGNALCADHCITKIPGGGM